MRRVVIIGSGGVAESLALSISQCSELRLVQIFGRNRQRVKELSNRCRVTVCNTIAQGDIYIIAVSDRAVAQVAESINPPQDSVVMHTSGSIDINAISHPRRGVLYPLQTFTAGRTVDISNVPFFVEGDGEVTAVAKILSSTVVEMDSQGRRELHLCAVFACNFVNSMYANAFDIAQRSNIPFEWLKPLIGETCAKALAVDDPHTAQTGPAARGDKAVQQRHLEMLNDEKLEKIYKILSLQIWETSKKM